MKSFNAGGPPIDWLRLGGGTRLTNAPTRLSPIREVFILSAGTHPEPHHLAEGLRRAGASATFLTSALLPDSHVIFRLAKSRVIEKSFGPEVQRRRLPSGTHNSGNTRLVAGLAELATVFATRMDAKAARRVVEWRTKRFRRSVARALKRSGRSPDVVVGQYTSCVDAFELAGDFRRVLMYPIAHHDWMAKYLAREAGQNPAWAPFLQGHDIAGAERDVLEREIRAADLILVPSTFARNTFLEMGVPEGKVRVVRLGAETRASLSSQEQRDRDFVVFFAGQVNQRKGVGYLVDALAKAGIPRARLVVAGQASAEVRESMTRSFPPTDFLGTMPRERLMNEMADADVLVMPSLAEGFGLVALEAMSVGTPAIVSTHTFASDVIEHDLNGWIVGAGDSSALAALLEELAADPVRVQRVGREAVLSASQYTWVDYGKAAAREILEFIQSAQ